MINFYKEDFAVFEALYLYNFLDTNILKDFYYTDFSRTSFYRRMQKLEQEKFVKGFRIGSTRNKNYTKVYSLDVQGINSLGINIDEKKAKKNAMLNQTWTHSLNSARILHILSKKGGYNKYPRKQVYHTLDEGTTIRPSGALVKGNLCAFLEYENYNSKNLYIEKLQKYDFYKKNKKILEHPWIQDCLDVALLFVFNTETIQKHSSVLIQNICKNNNYEITIFTLILSDLIDMENNIFSLTKPISDMKINYVKIWGKE